MITHDLCIAWNWQHDADFVALMGIACREHGQALLQITPDNLALSLQALASGKLAFRLLLDRASDDDPQFMPVVQWAREHDLRQINPHETARGAWDKANMHWQFIRASVNVPHAIILPAYCEQRDLPPLDLSPLGPSFSIKPASRGGGQGVINEASSLAEVVAARQQYPQDKYLLQAHVLPVQHGARLAWFRVIYCAGQVYPCWWDVTTHVYTAVDRTEETEQTLVRLRQVSERIAGVCGLELFSTEIAITADNTLVAVDYVNDPVDLRLQSRAVDGVPDDIVRGIADCLTALASS